MADEQFATGGYVSGPKPGDPPLVPDGCVFYWPAEPVPALPGVTVQIELKPPAAGEVAAMLRRWLR